MAPPFSWVKMITLYHYNNLILSIKSVKDEIDSLFFRLKYLNEEVWRPQDKG